MPRTERDFSAIDPGEKKNLSYGFGPQGQGNRPLADGEVIEFVSFQMGVIYGVDPTPMSRLLGSPVIQADGVTVTQKVGTCLAGVVYLIQATASTDTPGSQDLIAYSHLHCNPIS